MYINMLRTIENKHIHYNKILLNILRTMGSLVDKYVKTKNKYSN